MFLYMGLLSRIITGTKQGSGVRGQGTGVSYFSGFNPEEHNSGGYAPDNICKPC